MIAEPAGCRGTILDWQAALVTMRPDEAQDPRALGSGARPLR